MKLNLLTRKSYQKPQRQISEDGESELLEAINRADMNTTLVAREELKSAVLVTAKRLQHFDSSDVWAILPYWSGGNPSSLGAVMRWAVKEGYITPLKGVYHLSRKRSAHRRPVQRYQSNICRWK